MKGILNKNNNNKNRWDEILHHMNTQGWKSQIKNKKQFSCIQISDLKPFP